METQQSSHDCRDRASLSTPTTPSSSSSNSNNNNAAAALMPPTPTPPPRTIIPRSDSNNPYPTTFIQADTTTFKQVVQLLTGSAETAAKASAPAKNPIPPPVRPPGPKKPSFKLYERRGSFRHLKMINPLLPAFLSSPSPSPSPAAFKKHQPEILSPSMLDLPSLVLSPVTPLIHDPFNRCSPRPPSSASSSASEEERAIAEKGFFLHPSPRTPEPPRLLPLFPVTSPRISPSSTPP